jgi:hypothetical protein|tara:strand:- start:262 stop:771 length:510 start_codon:yes stop_codon:yes gene_type:complete
MNNAAQRIIESLTMNAEITKNNDWVVQDVMTYQRKIITEGILDKLSYLMNGQGGTEAYLDKQKQRVVTARKRYNGDEISTMFLKGAMAGQRAASDKQDLLTNLWNGLQQQYEEDTGDVYTPYNMRSVSNVAIDWNGEVPSDIAAELEALGHDSTDTSYIQNTDGVDTVQ